MKKTNKSKLVLNRVREVAEISLCDLREDFPEITHNDLLRIIFELVDAGKIRHVKYLRSVAPETRK